MAWPVRRPGQAPKQESSAHDHRAGHVRVDPAVVGELAGVVEREPHVSVRPATGIERSVVGRDRVGRGAVLPPPDHVLADADVDLARAEGQAADHHDAVGGRPEVAPARAAVVIAAVVIAAVGVAVVVVAVAVVAVAVVPVAVVAAVVVAVIRVVVVVVVIVVIMVIGEIPPVPIPVMIPVPVPVPVPVVEMAVVPVAVMVAVLDPPVVVPVVVPVLDVAVLVLDVTVPVLVTVLRLGVAGVGLPVRGPCRRSGGDAEAERDRHRRQDREELSHEGTPVSPAWFSPAPRNDAGEGPHLLGRD